MNKCIVLVAAVLVLTPLMAQAKDVSGESKQRAEQAQHAKKDMLQNADKDSDNLVSREEAKTVPWLDKRFDALDSNKDGQISKEEIAAAKSTHHEERKRKADEKFSKADIDQDGSISREEAEKGLRSIVSKFDVIDANKDGKITQAEISAYQHARMQHMRDIKTRKNQEETAQP